MNRRLIVMRHAKAEPYAAQDRDRVLAPRGVDQAAETGRWLAAEGIEVTHAYVSSAARTRGTWDGVAASAGSGAEVHFEDALYSGGPEGVLSVLRSAPSDAEVVMYIGHNPTAAYLAQLLEDGNGDPEILSRMSMGYPTAALTVFDVAVDWADLNVAGATLREFRSPDL